MALGLASKVALGGMAGAGLAGALAPEVLFGISYLEGDPERIRRAADVLDEMADAVDEHFREANDAAQTVWTKSSDKAVDEFKRFWEQEYGPALFAVSVKHRNAANACRAYADVIEKVNHALHVLCWILTVDMMYTIGYQVYTWKLFQMIMKRQAILLKLSAHRFVTLLLPTFAYWVADSVSYATGSVVLPLGLNYVGGIETDLAGKDVRSLDHNLTSFREHFVANMAFNGVIDGSGALMAKVPGLRTLTTNIPLPNGKLLNTGNFIPRMAASTTYSVALDVQRGDNPLPGTETGLTEQEMYQKFIVHGTRSLIPRI
ncbi:hypothetical protein OUY22_08060 [Nonomuraea sp. MCN248]|uniref:WXG100 family type VII secretion target n=1 Tax=Nonomuraea corallina TaxID=2989783 RepID=A0ABT4S811_9ACTN|nr:hypothetical protein [Nonomuraea corallina]MDA0633372.1 hypothetical protein [Nonomuraea corallina]